MRVLFAIGWFLAGAIAILAAILTAHGVGYLIVFPDGTHQIELASLFLAAATLIITTVAIILAVGAVVGYATLRDSAEAAGKLAGEEAARSALTIMVQAEVSARLGAPQGPDRTEELAAALAERGDDGGTAPN
jgi:membrane protein implicated in regulation of membrane protease activity